MQGNIIPCLKNPNLKYSWTQCLNPNISDIHQVDLEPLRKGRFFFVQIWTTNVYINFPLLFSFLSFCPTQGHPNLGF
jgi:hypothetical protein